MESKTTDAAAEETGTTMRSVTTTLTLLSFAAASLALSGCTLGSIQVTVKPDLSGSVELFRLSLEKRPPGQALELIGGATHEESEAVVAEHDKFTFPKLSELAVGDMRFNLVDDPEGGDPDGAKLTIRFPLSPQAKWLRCLEITEEELAAVLRRFREQKDEVPPFLRDTEEKLSSVELTIKLPWRLRETTIVCSAPGARSWIEEREAKQLGLRIPLEAVQRGGGELVTVEAVLSKRDAIEEDAGDDAGDEYRVRFRAALKLQSSKQFEEAVARWLALREVYPERPLIDYNLACAYALLGFLAATPATWRPS
jgi:hypothetical protein